MVKRFFYNPDNGSIQIFDNSHVEFYHNNKDKILHLPFDYYIRGIITEENTILLRVFYPYENINELAYEKLLFNSQALLKLKLNKIKKALLSQGINASDFILNVTNENTKEILKTNYV